MGVAERVQQWFHDAYGTVAAELRAQWDSMTTHGCWCGAGNRCEETSDGLDGCCKQHDHSYESAGISADLMWSAEGFVRGKDADTALVACAASNETTDSGYRDRLLALFNTRLHIAGVIEGWYEAARQAEEGVEGFRRWLRQHATLSQVDRAELQQYEEYLGGLGVGADEVQAVVADAGLPPGDSAYA